MILIQPNYYYCYRNYFDDYTHCRVFTHVSLPDFLAARGFEIERVTPRFLPFSMKSRLPRWSFLIWLYLRLPWRPLARQMLVIARKPLGVRDSRADEDAAGLPRQIPDEVGAASS